MSTRYIPAFSAPGVLFAVLGSAALFAPFMTLAANRIVAGEAVQAWGVAGPGAVIAGLAAIVAALALGLLAAWPRLRLVGAALGLAGLVWLLAQGTLDEIKSNEQVIEAYLGTGLKNKEKTGT